MSQYNEQYYINNEDTLYLKVHSRSSYRNLDKISNFEIPLTKAYKTFQSEEAGCGGETSVPILFKKYISGDIKNVTETLLTLSIVVSHIFLITLKLVDSMQNYNEDYYLIFPNPDTTGYKIDPDDSTARRNYDSDELNFGQKPLFFETRTPDLSFINNDYEIFFPIGSIVVTDKLKLLFEDGLYGAKFYPAIVKGEEKGVREDMWALNIYKPLDCWDRDKSVASYPGGVKSMAGIDVLPSVKSFHLSSKVLDKIPEKNRLLFVMDNTDVTNIFINKKFIDILETYNVKGSKFFKVSQYRFGMEFI